MSEYDELPAEAKLEPIDIFNPPTAPKHLLHVDGELGQVIDHLDPEEAAEFTRLRTIESRTDMGGVGVTAQRTFDRHQDGMKATAEQAKANVAAKRKG